MTSSAALSEFKRLRALLRVSPNIPQALGIIAPRQTWRIGQLLNVDSIRLSWAEPDIFRFIPRNTAPFAFKRASGETIVPRTFFTDGGSIPMLVRGLDPQLSPWAYGPAYLLHDWLYEVHHAADFTGAQSPRSFEDVRDVLLEAVNTLCAMKRCVCSDATFNLLFIAINSGVARKVWAAKPLANPIPPDTPE